MDKVQRAYTRFMCKKDLIFENHLLVGLTIQETDKIPTAATDGHSKMWYNPEFFSKLTVTEIMGVLAHECWHKGKLHTFRHGTRNMPKLWNICVDYEANAAVMAVGAPHFSLPGTAIGIDEFEQFLMTEELPEAMKEGAHFYDPRMIDTTFITAEELYDRFAKHAPNDVPQGIEYQPGEGNVLGSGDVFSGDMDPKIVAASKAEAEAAGKTESQLKSDATIDVQQAAKRADKQGVGSAHSKLAAQLAQDASVDWRRELRKWCTSHFNKNDWSFRRQNRQAIVNGLVLPTLHDEAAGPIVVAIDTSGSCLSALPQFGAEVKSLFKRIKPSDLYVIYADYEVAHVDHFTEHKQIKFAPHGGGGTSFKGPFKWVKERGIKPDAFVYLTDMYGDFPEDKPKYPVLWARTSDSNVDAPWGRVVPVKT